MLRFTRRLTVVTLALVCAAGAAGAVRLMRDASSSAKPGAGGVATSDAAPGQKKTLARANVGQPDEAMTESDFNEPFRRAMEAYAAAWLRERQLELRKQGVAMPNIISSVSYERIGGRKLMVARLRAANVHVAKILGIVDGETREAVCATEDDAKTLLTSRDCAKAIEDTFGVKAGR